MERRERTHQLVNTMFKAIQKICNEHKGEELMPNANMHGVVIFWFPENHDEDGAIHTTSVGHICTDRLLESCMRLIRTIRVEENKLAA